MYAPKVEITLIGDIGDVDGNLAFLAEPPDLGACFRVIHCRQDHVNAVKIFRKEGTVFIAHLPLSDAVSHF